MTLRNIASDCKEFAPRKPFNSYEKNHELNSMIYESLKTTKERKFAELCGQRRNQPAEINSSNTQDDHDYQSKLVVTIPDDLPLSEAENSVLSKGLTFVQVKRVLMNTEWRLIVKRFTVTSVCVPISTMKEQVSPKPHPTLVTHLLSWTTRSRPGHHRRANSQR